RVIDDLMRQIEGTGVDAGKARAQVAAMSCPFCGCNLAAVSAQIDGEPPKF
ncbi:MAG: hypothetical protein HY059_00945, partial [Proteobacteria bacterium]|nr:hypothetical protein [Pseudomonadota bacterium]